MLATLGWLLAIIGFIGCAGCVAIGCYSVWRAIGDPETKTNSQKKFMAALGSFIGFFLVAALGAILLQVTGAYAPLAE